LMSKKKASKRRGSSDSGSAAAAEANEDANIQQIYEQRMLVESVDELTKEAQRWKKVATEAMEKNSKQEMQHKDLLWYLNKEIKEKDQTIEMLKKQNALLKSEKTSEVQEVHDLLTKQQESYEEQTESLRKQLAGLRASYEELKQFTQDKDVLEQSVKDLRDNLEDEKRQHAIHVSELERRNVSEKNRLKKEMLRKVKETKLSLLAMTEDQLHTTTKRTIMENEQITTELHYQSKVVEKLIKRNDELTAENKRLRSQIDLLEEAQKMLATRTNFFQKLIQKLNEKIKRMAAASAPSVSTISADPLSSPSEAHKKKKLSRSGILAEVGKDCSAPAESLGRHLADLDPEQGGKKIGGGMEREEEEVHSIPSSFMSTAAVDDAVRFLSDCLDEIQARSGCISWLPPLSARSAASTSSGSSPRLGKGKGLFGELLGSQDSHGIPEDAGLGQRVFSRMRLENKEAVVRTLQQKLRFLEQCRQVSAETEVSLPPIV